MQSALIHLTATIVNCSTGRLVTALVVTLISLGYYKTKPLSVPSSLPGPRRYPWIGYLLHVLRHWHVWPSETARLAKLYKRTWGGPLPNFGGLPGAYFYLHEEDNVRHVLQTNFVNYAKGDMWVGVLGEILGRGIFAVDGDRWRTHRKLMSHMFSRNLLRESAVVTRNKLLDVLDSFERKIATLNNSPGIDGFNIDLQDVFFRLTIDVTCITTFGIDLKNVQNEEQHSFARAFDELAFLCQQRFPDPLFRVKRFLRLTWRERRIQYLKTVIDDFAYQVISHKRRTVEEEGSTLGPDLLSRYIQHGKKTNEEMCNSDLRDVVMNILLAGRDTTACALSWTFFELTRHPDVVEKVVAEVKSICGVGKNAEYTYDTMSRLNYTHCVAMEVLRLHPPVPIDLRLTGEDDVLPDGTKIPRGAGICLLFYAMGRDEDLWGDDVMQFKPGRFLNDTEPSPYKFTAFNAGPRMCLGKPLALLNMKLAMSILLTSDFIFEDKIGHSGEYLWTLVASMKNGFEVNVTKQS